MHTPLEVRPQRPERWFADACEIGSIGSRCTFNRWLYREMRAVPASITYFMPGTVSDVSATFVASTTRRPVCGWNTLYWSAGGQPRVQRRDLGVAQLELAQRVRRVPDLPFAAAEHEDVAWTQRAQFADRVADRLHLVPVGVGVRIVGVDDRPVAEFDRVGAAGHLDHRRRHAVVAEVPARTGAGRSSPT